MNLHVVSFTQVPVTGATDVWELAAGSTKSIYVKKIVLSGLATTVVNPIISLIKRSSAATGGTSTTGTITRRDRATNLSGQVCKIFTGNPTVGTAVNTIRSQRICLPLTNSVINATYEIVFDEPVKIAPTQFLCLNMNATAIAGGSLTTHIEFDIN